MSYKSILVYVDPAKESQRRLEAAASIAKKFDGMIIGVAAPLLRPFTDPYGDPIISTSIGPELKDKERRVTAERGACESVFRKWAGAANVPSEWRDDAEYVVDLIVVSPQKNDDASDFRPIDIGALLLKSGRPVLCLPPQSRWNGAGRVIVAWKNTREARRVLADALPALQAAERVAVIEVVEPELSSDGSARAAAAFLRRHGVEAEARSEPQRATSVEEQLFARAADENADLIVAGSYGHSRLGEWVFGGVTRALINDSPVPVMLSH